MSALKVLTLLAPTLLVHSSEDEIPGLRKLGQTKSMLATKLNIPEADAKNLLRGYGCFCYVQGSTSAGPAFKYHGEAVDPLDQLCKDLYKAEKCIGIDSLDGNYRKGCFVDQSTKFSNIVNPDGTVSVICNDDQNQCKEDMCNIENDFSSKVAELFNTGYQTNNSFKIAWQDEAGYKSLCPAPERDDNGGMVAMSCCGKGLDRAIYNPLLSECCNEEISSLGSC